MSERSEFGIFTPHNNATVASGDLLVIFGFAQTAHVRHLKSKLFAALSESQFSFGIFSFVHTKETVHSPDKKKVQKKNQDYVVTCGMYLQTFTILMLFYYTLYI